MIFKWFRVPFFAMLKDHKDSVTALQFNWNDTVIASASQSGEIILYNVVTGLGYSPLIAPKVQVSAVSPVFKIQYNHLIYTINVLILVFVHFL